MDITTLFVWLECRHQSAKQPKNLRCPTAKLLNLLIGETCCGPRIARSEIGVCDAEPHHHHIARRRGDVVAYCACANLSIAADYHGSAICRGRFIRRHRSNLCGPNERNPGSTVDR